MRLIAGLFIVVLLANFAFANEIDQLRSWEDVNKFVHDRVIKDEPDMVFLEEDKSPGSKFGKNKFFKLDLDGNGLTDLVIDGRYFFAISDLGGKYDFYSLDKGTFSLNKYTLINIIYKDKIPLLVIRRYNPDDGSTLGRETEKTVLMKFDDFIEYNANPDNLRIQQIDFSTTQCFGACPVFKLSISQGRKAKYDAIEHNDLAGKFESVIDAKDFEQLIQTINYISPESLKNKYAVDWTDDQGATLTVKYNNGKVKRIGDYGMIGTFGLENLYNQLSLLRKTQNWTKHQPTSVTH